MQGLTDDGCEAKEKVFHLHNDMHEYINLVLNHIIIISSRGIVHLEIMS